ncbi:uncharacterized protein Tco025E_08662 [Trypanosoma conorhini]|uniref:Uncharacterized protein n=1 Tax=Trypanosoma conorhini TaxID=83891 RepID=A0A422N6I9_9TRYP|nr:uncharacterized protein Tco025E_08662 [Trypanosoma conorhini]RNF01069.1 hypothetical protein Tco025E_08662 [Trypanosoma conorhini]
MRSAGWMDAACASLAVLCRRGAHSSGVTEATHAFSYRPRWQYSFPFRSKRLTDFVTASENSVSSVAYTYQHAENRVVVTLIPLQHFAHPQFFHQVDALCSQHESVLMEGRTPLAGAPFSTIVPPREGVASVRPAGHEDDEGWEPREIERFWQPFSWGVKDSPTMTIIHAADKYDYEKLPWWCSLRFNAPLIGSFAREKHCLDMIYPLASNGYKSFAIPWGAAHMPIFNEMLIDNGFEQIGMCSLLVLNRIDGEISAGEHERFCRIEKRHHRLIQLAWGLAIVAGLLLLRGMVVVEYRKD